MPLYKVQDEGRKQKDEDITRLYWVWVKPIWAGEASWRRRKTCPRSRKEMWGGRASMSTEYFHDDLRQNWKTQNSWIEAIWDKSGHWTLCTAVFIFKKSFHGGRFRASCSPFKKHLKQHNWSNYWQCTPNATWYISPYKLSDTWMMVMGCCSNYSTLSHVARGTSSRLAASL